jgi:hypothetical protein
LGYLQASTILGVPVPKVLDWSATKENPARTEYILMEEAAGTPLGSKWDSSDVDVKSAIVDDLVTIAKKLLAVSFSRLVFVKQACSQQVY